VSTSEVRGLGNSGDRIDWYDNKAGTSVTANTQCHGNKTSSTWGRHKNLRTGTVGYSWYWYLVSR
jgi:hypothetical protein